jgi:hypothetical protein
MPRWTFDDARLVANAAPLYVGCIISETGVTKVRVEPILVMRGETLTIVRSIAPCGVCRLTKEVVRLA